MSDRLDAIVFGATGFTGIHAVAELHRQVKNRNGFKWGIAGRAEDKLKKVITDLETKTGDDLSNVALIKADISDEKSMVEMTGKAKVVINTVGPYRFYGEAVLKACIETGTHQVDVSGEPQYMEEMMLKYNDQAKEKGVYLISACGMDSIPCDIGTLFIEKKFDGVVNSVESFLDFTYSEKLKNIPGSRVNYGTWASAVHGLAHSDELKSLRRQLYPERLPKFEPKVTRKTMPHRNDVVGGKWVVPFPGCDRSVVQRSQRILYENDKKRPVQMEAYMVIQSFWALVVMGIFGVVFSILTKFSVGRRLLLNYPEFFSGGFFSKTPPNEEVTKNTTLMMLLYAQGWDASDKLSEPTDKYTTPPNKTLIARVSGQDPGYTFTSACLVTCGLTILDENNKMPGTGGVLPPGAAFAKTDLIQKLLDTGLVKLEVLSVKTDVCRDSKL